MIFGNHFKTLSDYEAFPMQFFPPSIDLNNFYMQLILYTNSYGTANVDGWTRRLLNFVDINNNSNGRRLVKTKGYVWNAIAIDERFNNLWKENSHPFDGIQSFKFSLSKEGEKKSEYAKEFWVSGYFVRMMWFVHKYLSRSFNQSQYLKA